jgi:hypothetical protein
MRSEMINGLFALGGALIGVSGAWLVARYQKQRRRITIFTSYLAQLLDIGAIVKSEVKVLYKDREIENLFGGEFAIQNSGNASVKDVSIRIIPDCTTPIVEADLASANFPRSENTISLNREGDDILVNIDLLNQNDRIVISYKAIGEGKLPQIDARQADVEVSTRKEFISWLPDIYAEAMFQEISNRKFLDLVFRSIKPYRLYLESKKRGS